MKLIPVVICGGAGARLWPLSRELHPKPFIRLQDGQSLLQKAWLRGTRLPGVEETLTITNRELVFKIEDEYREITGLLNERQIANHFVLEPVARNTAPAIAAAALRVAVLQGEEACLLVLPADHLVANQPAFERAVTSAMELAAQGKLVTFGIKPETPETGYGYIEAEGNHVRRFVEKPNLKAAQEYLDSGRYLWNSGMFCFKAGTMLKEMREHCPEILKRTMASMDNSYRTEGHNFSQVELEKKQFAEVPDDSIDYAVMEKSSNVAVVPCDLGWSDIGSWTALGGLIEPDTNENRIEGEVILYDVGNCYIRSDKRIVAAAGVRDLVIIDTPDAVMVANRNSVQDVKHLYAELKARGHEAYRLHSTVTRPWGTYTVLEEGPKFKIKRIEVNAGASLSLQMHHHRSEHWIVVSGMARVFNGNRDYCVETNESTYIPAGHKHRLENTGKVPLVIIEVQSGEYLGEDDIVRFDDMYGRVRQ